MLVGMLANDIFQGPLGALHFTHLKFGRLAADEPGHGSSSTLRLLLLVQIGGRAGNCSHQGRHSESGALILSSPQSKLFADDNETPSERSRSFGVSPWCRGQFLVV